MNKKIYFYGMPVDARNIGIVSILAGTAILLLSLIFSSGNISGLGLIENIKRMEIVFSQGRYVPAEYHYTNSPNNPSGSSLWDQYDRVHRHEKTPAHIAGKLSIPTKYPVSLSIILILFGIASVTIRKEPHAPVSDRLKDDPKKSDEPLIHKNNLPETTHSEKIANLLQNIAWEPNLTHEEKSQIDRAGLDWTIYQVEVQCLQVHSTLFAYSIWEGRKHLDDKTDKEIIRLFHEGIRRGCAQISPNPGAFHEHIQIRGREYLDAQEEDMIASENNILSMKFPSLFARNIIPDDAKKTHDIPHDFILIASSRFHENINRVHEALKDSMQTT